MSDLWWAFVCCGLAAGGRPISFNKSGAISRGRRRRRCWALHQLPRLIGWKCSQNTSLVERISYQSVARHALNKVLVSNRTKSDPIGRHQRRDAVGSIQPVRSQWKGDPYAIDGGHPTTGQWNLMNGRVEWFIFISHSVFSVLFWRT